MILNVKVQDTPTLVIKGSNQTNVAVVLISISNVSSTNKTFGIFVCQNGKTPPTFDSSGNVTSGNIETVFIKRQTLTSDNTIILNTEKILLGDNDSLYLICYEDSNSLVAVVSYEMY